MTWQRSDAAGEGGRGGTKLELEQTYTYTWQALTRQAKEKLCDAVADLLFSAYENSAEMCAPFLSILLCHSKKMLFLCTETDFGDRKKLIFWCAIISQSNIHFVFSDDHCVCYLGFKVSLVRSFRSPLQFQGANSLASESDPNCRARQNVFVDVPHTNLTKLIRIKATEAENSLSTLSSKWPTRFVY